MTPFKFGSVNIDPIEYGSSGNAILGIRDSGKTYTATGLGEHLFEAGIPFIAFDPVGVWRFMRVPGRGRGYPIVVAGGKSGDLPLTPASAPAIVEAAMQTGVSLVLDLFTYELSKADWKRIVRDSVRLLLHRNSDYGLRHVFLEEAAEFAPQRVGPDSGAVYAEIEKLARMGGNSRLGYTLINQRAEEVNKAVLELCDSMFLHRQRGRNSLTALSKWLDVGNVKDVRSITSTLSTLPTGECWAWLRGSDEPVRVKVPAKNSLHPDRRVMRGDATTAEVKRVDVDEFVSGLKRTLEKLERAAAHDAEPKSKAAPATAPIDKAQLAAEYRRGLDEGEVIGYTRGFREAMTVAAARARDLATYCDQSAVVTPKAQGGEAIMAVAPTSMHAGFTVVAHEKPSPELRKAVRQAVGADPAPAVDDGAPMKRAERVILQVLAQYPAGRSARQLAVIGRYAQNGGGFKNAMGALRSRGFIVGGADLMQITDAGRAAAGPIEPLPRGRALLEHWLSQLKKRAERQVLEAIVEVYPRTLSPSAIANRTGYEMNGGGFKNALGKLRTLQLIVGTREIKAADELVA